MRRVTRTVAAVFAACVVGACPAAAEVRFSDGHGLHVTAQKQLSPRLYAVTVTTPLLKAPANVRVLLPADYETSGRRRFPVLWLWHGTSGGAQDWTTKGNAVTATAGRELITVMPDAGINSDGGSWFTDWDNNGAGGAPFWETFHIKHLLPWIDAQLRTVDSRDGRAIAGLSQGGFGTMSYAARHPDLFGQAASFSGAVAISATPEAIALVTPIIHATEMGLNRVAPGTFFGSRLTNEINYAAHDPATLVGNLRWTSLFSWAGNGRPGPLDDEDGGYNPAAAAIEAGVHELTAIFHDQLTKAGIPIDFHDYGPGIHSWPYWNRDLSDLVPRLMRGFADPEPAPAKVSYTSADATFAQWGWSVKVDRPVREFATLGDAGVRGFSLSGTGQGIVTTPRVYRPGAVATVTLSGPFADATRSLRVGSDGALSVDVPLGPANGAQQFTLGTTTQAWSTAVRIAAPLRRAAARKKAAKKKRAAAQRRPAKTKRPPSKAGGSGRR